MKRIALLPIKGMIVSEKSPFSMIGITSSLEIVPLIKDIQKKGAIKALVIEVNSPGGTPFACKEIADAVKALGKPTVAWVREMAASGGLWVASAADSVVADSLSTIGSVGVTSMRPDVSELLKKIGVDMDVVATGLYKSFGVPFKPLTPDEKREERHWREEEIKIIHDSFLEEISGKRKLSRETVEEISSGKTYLGKEAKRLGLVDELGGKEKALQIAADNAKITTYKVIDYTKKVERPRRRLLNRLLGLF